MNNIMIDIETMGHVPYSAIVSIAAVRFDIENGAVGEEFFTVVDLKSCIDIGLVMTAETVMWWMPQSDEARNHFVNAQMEHIESALVRLNYFIHNTDYVWGNSARFDLGILSDAYRKANISEPWDFRNERDVRTISALMPEVRGKMPFAGIKHNPVNDCKHQIMYVCEIYKRLMLNKLSNTF